MLRTFIRSILLAETKQFDEHLTPEVMRLLIKEYAEPGGVLGSLNWKYSDKLGARTWGLYNGKIRTLYVNRAKTRHKFKQQVETILHEIQHWNQHAFDAENAVRDFHGPGGEVDLEYIWDKWHHAYAAESEAAGYWNNQFEVDARSYASVNLQGAMKKIGMLYGGRTEGEVDDAVEELFDEYSETGKALTRGLIGQTLADYSLIGPQYMKQALEQLRDLEVEIR